MAISEIYPVWLGGIVIRQIGSRSGDRGLKGWRLGVRVPRREGKDGSA